MKILTILVITLTFSLVLTKDKLKGRGLKQITKVDQLLDAPLHTALPNDGFTLQHQNVITI